MKKYYKRLTNFLQKEKVKTFSKIIAYSTDIIFGVLICCGKIEMTELVMVLIGLSFVLRGIYGSMLLHSKSNDIILVSEDALLDDFFSGLGNNIDSISYDVSTEMWRVSYLNHLEDDLVDTEGLYYLLGE